MRRSVRRVISPQLQAEIVNRNAIIVNLNGEPRNDGIVDAMEDIEDPLSLRGSKLRFARDQQKRRLQFFVIWTFIQICVTISLSFNTNDSECAAKSTCNCGTAIKIQISLQTAIFFLITITQIKSYSLVTRRYASRHNHKKRSRLILYFVLPIMLGFMFAGWVIFLLAQGQNECYEGSEKYRYLIHIDRILLLVQLM